MRGLQEKKSKSKDWNRMRSCQEEKANEQTGKNADAADAEKR